MKLRNLILSVGIAGLLAPAAVLAADTTTAPAASTAAADTAAPAKGKHKGYTSCERVSGTAIVPSKKDGCKSFTQPYRSYSQEELQRTGEIDLGKALRKIDPIFY